MLSTAYKCFFVCSVNEIEEGGLRTVGWGRAGGTGSRGLPPQKFSISSEIYRQGSRYNIFYKPYEARVRPGFAWQGSEHSEVELQPEAPTRTTGCRKFVENEMLGANLGFVVSKVGKFEEFLTGLASFKAKYQVNGRGYRPSSMRYFTFYRFRTKVENLPDHVDSFPTGGGHGPYPHLASPLFQRRSDSPFIWLSLVFAKSTNFPIQTKTFRRHSLAVEFLLLFTLDFRVLHVSLKQTQNKHLNQWRTDCCYML